jgi:catechol 2,3-dioxygenase
VNSFSTQTAKLQNIALRVKKFDEMIDFYQKIVGFSLLREENNLAIFGTKSPYDELLILEDTPMGTVDRGHAKKLARFSLRITSKEEFYKILRQMLHFNIPLLETKENKCSQAFMIEDPEGNHLAIYHFDPVLWKSGDCREFRPIDLTFVKKRYPFGHGKLMGDVSLGQLHLNVQDLEASRFFYHELLGMNPEEEGRHLFSLDLEKRFGLKVADIQVDEAMGAWENLGIDFATLAVTDRKVLEKIAQNLNKFEIEFFMDKKQKILTVYDPNGIEWWFMRDYKRL